MLIQHQPQMGRRLPVRAGSRRLPGLLGRVCFTAGIVLLVLAAVRRLDRR